MTLSSLASMLGLTLKGEDREFSGLNTITDASETEVTFLSNPRYVKFLKDTKACAVIVSKEHAGDVRSAALISDNPYVDYARAASLFVREQGEFSGVSELAWIHPDAEIGKDCVIHPFARIGARSKVGGGTAVFPGAYIGEDCVIGESCCIWPNAVILAGVTLGDCCVINSGAVIGTDGFGFVRHSGMMFKIPQIGTVELADGVDVGANSCIDRSALGATSIGDSTKIDNLVQIGHNVKMGEQCLIISQVGISGSTKVGDRVTMAGQAGISGHLNIGDDVTIGPQAGVPKDIADGITGGGSPFMEGSHYMRVAATMPKLHEMNKKIAQLEKEIDRLKALFSQEEK